MKAGSARLVQGEECVLPSLGQKPLQGRCSCSAAMPGRLLLPLWQSGPGNQRFFFLCIPAHSALALVPEEVPGLGHAHGAPCKGKTQVSLENRNPRAEHHSGLTEFCQLWNFSLSSTLSELQLQWFLISFHGPGQLV